MTHRRILFGLLLCLPLLACGVSLLWLANSGPVARARFEKVKEGMSRAEMIHTVGGPSNGYGSPSFELFIPCEHWIGDDADLFVQFDDTGNALHVFYRPQPTILERVRKWLGI